MTGMGTELTRAARRLVRAPVFTSVSVLTIGVGIGAFAAIYSVVDSVLLEAPPYRAPEQLEWIWRDYWFGLHRGWLGGPDIVHLREHDEAFEGVVAFRTGGANLTGRRGDNPERIGVMLASADFFDVLGVAPVLGRGFVPGEDAPDAAPVAVLGYDLWRTHFGGARDVIGRDIYLDGEATTVVGVAPPAFHFVKHSSLGRPEGADLYVPLRWDLAAEDPGSGSFGGLARVREGASPAQVDAAIAATAKILDDLWGNPGLKMWGVGLKDDLVSGVRPALLSILVASGFLLLILAANLATLLLGRATTRDRELAVIAALGAGRGRLLQSVLAEAVLVAAAGAAVGVGLAYLGVDVIRSIAPEDLPRRLDIALDASVLLVSLGVAAGMVLVAVVPAALRALRSGVALRLRDAGGRAGGGFAGSRTRSALVVAQVALSLVLLVSATLLTRAFARLLEADPGFDGRDALTFQVALTSLGYPDDASVVDFDRRLRAGLEALPGVRVAGAIDALPLSADASQQDISFPDAPVNEGLESQQTPLIDHMYAGPGYAEAVGLRLLEGRFFNDGDDASAPRVIVIDDELAEQFYPDGGAVGARAEWRGGDVTVVGVVDQARMYQVQRDDRAQVYDPLLQRPERRLFYVVAGDREAGTLAPEVRRVVDAIDASVPISGASTLAGIIDASLGKERLSLTLLMTFAGGALALAILGIYGVVSNGVSRRTHEMGVRIALGADRARVVSMVLRQGLRLSALGTAVGVGGAVWASRFLGGVMTGVEPKDPAAYAGVAAALVGLTALAAFVPARRATRIDPVEALRAE